MLTQLVAAVNWVLRYVYYVLSFLDKPMYKNGKQLQVRRPYFNEELDTRDKSQQAKLRRERYGDIYASYDGRTRFVVIGSYADVRSFYRQNQPIKADCSFFGFAYDRLVSKMMGVVNGQAWKDSRAPVAHTYSYQGMQGNVRVITREVDAWMDVLNSALTHQSGESATASSDFKLNLRDMSIHTLARGVLFTLIYGELSEQDHVDIDEVTRLTGIACTAMAADYSSRYKIITQNFNTPTVQNSIELWERWSAFNERKLVETQGRSDILLPVMASHPAYQDRVCLFETIHEMTVLNVEIVVHVVSHMIYCLAAHPGIQGEIHEEILDFSRHPLEALTSIDVLPNVKAFVAEVSRLYPAVNFTFPETTTAPVNVNGCVITPGQKLTFDANLINSDPSVWQAPDQFDPGRFLGAENRTNYAKVHRFGFGSRKCLGNVYGDYVVAFVIERLVRQYQLRLVGEAEKSTTEAESFPMVMNRAELTNVVQFLPREH